MRWGKKVQDLRRGRVEGQKWKYKEGENRGIAFKLHTDAAAMTARQLLPFPKGSRSPLGERMKI